MSGLYFEVFSGITYEEMFPMIRQAGFDGFFSNERYCLDLEAMTRFRKLGDRLGLDYETSHARIPGSNTIWNYGPEGDAFLDVLRQCMDNCVALSIPTVIVHIQPNPKQEPSFDLGIRRLTELVRCAKTKGVKIAFENMFEYPQLPSFLCRTLDHFQDSHVGYCYDSGHEGCRGGGIQYLPIIGDRLFCTHLHDNDTKGDQHMLPYDGQIGFDRVVQQLKACGYRGNFTLEVSYDSYVDRMSKEAFIQKGYGVAANLRRQVLEE